MVSTPITRAAFLINSGGDIVTWNDGCERLFGLTQEQILSKKFFVLFDGAAKQDVEMHLQTIPPRSTVIELQIHCSAGKTFHATLNLAPQFDQNLTYHAWTAAFATTLESNATESTRLGSLQIMSVVSAFAGIFYMINQEGKLVLWNHNLELLADMTEQEIAATDVVDMFEGVYRSTVANNIRRVFEEGVEVKFEANYVTRGGKLVPLLLGGSRFVCNGQTYVLGMGMDITERRELEQQLRLRQRALHAAASGIIIARCIGHDCPIEYVNPAFERITGYSVEEVLGHDSRFMAAPGLDMNERQEVRNAILARRAVNVVFRNTRKDGTIFWNDLSITPVHHEDGAAMHFIGVIVDVTEAKQRATYLEHEVHHDGLTGLANRNLMWDRLEHAIHCAQRSKSLVGVVLIDLNNFKIINDTFGHEAGDTVLQVVAKRLLTSVRDSDTVARLSGDEFVLLLDNQPSLRYTLRMIERVRQAFLIPVSFGDTEIPIGASVGVSVYPHDGANPFDLVRAADVAMYNAKAAKTSKVHFYSPEMKSTTEAKKRLESSMHEAVEQNELFLVYQPRFFASSEKITGLEALLRWRHPEHGIMLPLSFLPDAEENGMIVRIGNKVLDQVCAFVQDLAERGYPHLCVSVNAFYKEYRQQDYVSRIGERIAKYGIPPNSLEIELRAQDLIQYPALSREVVCQLHEMGVFLTIDEFGGSMFDLTLLRELPVKYLKLASTAVHAIGPDNGSGAMAKILLDIGSHLGLKMIGKNIETQQQLQFLTSHGCDEFQGRFFKEPLTVDAINQMLPINLAA